MDPNPLFVTESIFPTSLIAQKEAGNHEVAYTVKIGNLSSIYFHLENVLSGPKSVGWSNFVLQSELGLKFSCSNNGSLTYLIIPVVL